MTDKTLARQVPLDKYSTLGVGGPARYFAVAESIAQMKEALAFAKNQSVPFLVLGKGSNCLFDDRGFNGLVILNKISFLEERAPGIFEVGAGYSFSRLGVVTAKKGFKGLEFASGIPGTVGGAVYMNAGANGSETCEALTSVAFVDAEGILHHYSKEELVFRYRSSSFQQMPGAIVGATFSLEESPQARAKQLKILDYRIQTQPYSDKSAGCIFRNPTAEQPAGGLIEKCGLKGLSIGGAEVSSLHANFIVNREGATAGEILALIEEVRRQVSEKTGVALDSEVRVIPYEEAADEQFSR